MACFWRVLIKLVLILIDLASFSCDWHLIISIKLLTKKLILFVYFRLATVCKGDRYSIHYTVSYFINEWHFNYLYKKKFIPSPGFEMETICV